MRSKKKHPLKYYIFLFFISFIPIFLFEGILVLAGYGDSYPLIIKYRENDLHRAEINPRYMEKFIHGDRRIPQLHSLKFSPVKEAGSDRIVLAGSDLFYGEGNIADDILEYLKKYAEKINADAINISYPGNSSDVTMLQIREILPLHPDLVIVSLGNGEFSAEYGGGLQPAGSGLGDDFFAGLYSFRTYQLLRDIFHKHLFSDEMAHPDRMNDYIDRGSEEYKKGLQRFKNNITEISRICRENGVPMLWVMMPADLKNSPPRYPMFRDPELDPVQLTEEFLTALAENDTISVARELRYLKIWESQSPLTLYLKGLYFLDNNMDSAYKYLSRARDLDGSRAFGGSEINIVVKELCQREGWMYLDLGKEFFFDGEEMFSSALSLNSAGRTLLADRVAGLAVKILEEGKQEH